MERRIVVRGGLFVRVLERVRGRLGGDERGLALVVALVITLLVFILTTAILADSFHNVVGSADSRNRAAAVAAAESGIAWYSKTAENLGVSGLGALTAGLWSPVGTPTNVYELASPIIVPGDPKDAHFTLRATYGTAYAAASDTVSCPAPCSSFSSLTATTVPPRLWVEVVSTGWVVAATSREVRAVFELLPTQAQTSGAFTGIYICQLGNSFRISGPDADMFVLGTDGPKPLCNGSQSSPYAAFQVSSGRFETSGSVYVLNGSAYLKTTTKIDGDLWAEGNVTVGVSGTVTPGFGQCSSTNSAQQLVCGDAVAVGSMTVNGPRGRVLGSASTCPTCVLPALTFPFVSKVDFLAKFTSAAGWPVTPASTLPDLRVATATKQLVEVPCGTAMPTKSMVLKGDVALVSDCGFAFTRGMTVTASPGYRPKLYLIVGATGAPCSATDVRDIAFSQNFDSTAVDIFLYSECKVSFRNQANLTGQIVSGGLSARGNTKFTASTIFGLDGTAAGTVSGFLARVLSLREL